MNQLSWSHILQRAESEASGEAGTVVIDFENRDSQKPDNQRQSGSNTAKQAQTGDGLKHAANRPPQDGGRRGFKKIPARHETILDEKNHPRYKREQLAGTHPVPAVGIRRREIPPSAAPAPQKAKASRAKNLLAAILALAVFGVAAYKIKQESGEQNRELALTDETRQSGNITAAISSTTNNTSSDSANVAAVLEQKPEFDGNRLDLRPSLAEPGDMSLSDQAVLSPGAGDDSPAPSAKEPAFQLRGPSTETENTMLRRGRNMIERGHIAGARLIFQHLAEQNSALGAFALAQTYDPDFLSGYGALGAQPDKKLAAKWYERAAELTNLGTKPNQ